MDKVIYLWDIEHTCIEHGALMQGDDGEWYCPQCEAEAPRCETCGGAVMLTFIDSGVTFRCERCGKEMEE